MRVLHRPQFNINRFKHSDLQGEGRPIGRTDRPPHCALPARRAADRALRAGRRLGRGLRFGRALLGLGVEGAQLDRGFAHARRDEVEAQVPGLVAILEGDADARPEAFLVFAFAAFDGGEEPASGLLRARAWLVGRREEIEKVLSLPVDDWAAKRRTAEEARTSVVEYLAELHGAAVRSGGGSARLLLRGRGGHRAGSPRRCGRGRSNCRERFRSRRATRWPTPRARGLFADGSFGSAGAQRAGGKRERRIAGATFGGSALRMRQHEGQRQKISMDPFGIVARNKRQPDEGLAKVVRPFTRGGG